MPTLIRRGYALSSHRKDALYCLFADRFEIVTDSAGPGEFRGGVGLDKGGTILDVENCVFS